MKQVLLTAALFLSVAAKAQVPAMPDAANVGQAAKGGAVAEAMTDSVKPADANKENIEGIKKPNNMIWGGAGLVVVIAVVAAAARRRRIKNQQ